MPIKPFRLKMIAPALLSAALMALIPASGARAAGTLNSFFQDDPHMFADPAGTLAELRSLGVETVRVAVRWQLLAPNPNSRRRPRFNASNPAAYPGRGWAIFDRIVRAAQRAGIGLDFDLQGGIPLWAAGPPLPGDRKPHYDWEPSPREYGQFVRAAGTRYSGHYTPRGASSPLPRVTFWSIWNEPDYGPSLAPQGLPGHLRIEYSPRLYRGLVDAAWAALHASGHGSDTILFGELAPRGQNYWGVFSGMKPLVFLRAMYCVDSRYRRLKGAAAALRGCPTTAAGSRRFRSANPALFAASGFADHPYMRWYQPNRERPFDRNYSSLGAIGELTASLDRLQRVYGSHTRFPIYDTEFGYITSPPKHRTKYPWVTVTTAAYYLNWAEYIHWRNPRLMSFEQFLLADPLAALPSNDFGGFASGLRTFRGAEKPTYPAWRLPLYLPSAAARPGTSLEVWGCVRPARYAIIDTGQAQIAQIQFQPGSAGPWTTLRTVTISDAGNCYFDVPVSFPGSGTVRLAYTYPAGASPNPGTVYSRSVQVAVK
jgi:hypothetical protein